MDKERSAAVSRSPAAGVDDVCKQRHQVHPAQAEPAVPRLLRGVSGAPRAAPAGRRRRIPRPLVPLL